MTAIEEAVPAFSMWKMFNDTLPALFKQENCEGSVEKLGNIIKSDAFSNIFVYNYNASVTMEEYESISTKYKSFTVWLLGRFFYLLSSEKLARVHDAIVDAQLKILHLMSVKQHHVYQELAGEYCAALNVLTSYLRDCKDVKFNLKVFVPQQHNDLKGKLDLSPTYIEITSKTVCLNILRKIIRILKKILGDNFESHYLNATISICLQNLLYIVGECDVSLKLKVLDAVFSAVYHIRRENCHISFIDYLDDFAVFLEQLVYETFNNKIEMRAKDKLLLESVLIAFNDSYFYSTNSFRRVRICEFILNKHTDELNLTRKIVSQCMVIVRNSEGTNVNSDEIIGRVFTSNKADLLCLIERELNSQDELWRKVLNALRQNWQSNDCCKNGCTLPKQLKLFEETANIAVRLKLNTVTAQCFEEFTKCCSRHFTICAPQVTAELFLNATVSCGLFSPIPNLNLISNLVLHTLCLSSIQSNTQNNNLNKCYMFLTSQKPEVASVLRIFNKLLTTMFLRNFEEIYAMKKYFLQCINEIFKRFLSESTADIIVEIFTTLHKLLKCPDELTKEVFLPLLELRNSEVVKCATAALSNIICMGTSNCYIRIFWNESENNLTAQLVCCKCGSRSELEQVINTIGPISTTFKDNSLKYKISQFILRNIQTKQKLCTQTKIHLIRALPPCTKHLSEFINTSSIKMWMVFLDDECKEVAKVFANTLCDMIRGVQGNSDLSKEQKHDFTINVCDSLKFYTKQSLQYSRAEVQETILETLTNLSSVKSEIVVLHVIDLLLYFIMCPTSKHSLMAVNTFLTIEKKHKTKINDLYVKFRKEICQRIVELCAINQALINRTLHASLRKVGVLLGFFSTKDFVTQECEYLLSFMVPLLAIMPKVSELICEMAEMIEIELPQLLATKYGGIFLNIYLREPEHVYLKAMEYLERETGMPGPTLRKNNFRVILNELLLNFHVNPDKVLQLLRLLVEEDNQECRSLQSIQDYLQPLLLGVLSYFDRKLEQQSEQKNALLSLAQLFKLLGAKHLSSMRFKIIAMLRTASRLKYGGFPDLNCDVWEAFVRSYDISAIGPQLATIFVSVLPLLDYFPDRVNNIYRYLIVENEQHLQENIRDIFFVNDERIDIDNRSVIIKHTETYLTQTFKAQLNHFVKYLNHETIDVRVHSLKFIKDLLERNREELDHMILGYNGIDPIVVTLLDALICGCREKDKELKLMCAVVFGELGAIEPSHLPRRYALQARSFVFFITDEGFVTTVLTELIRALQAEVKTQNLDRYSLAIQEILKVYGVSPNETSPGFRIWQQFNEVQQELMRPLLSSKYMNVQSTNFNFSTPIYGSSAGTSFTSWIYNWTCRLVSAINSEKKTLLHACLPSMKEERVLMEFLPHILLHALLEGSTDEYGKIYSEMLTVISSVSNQHKLDEDVLEVRPLRSLNMIANPQAVTPEEVKQKACTRVVFILFDFLERWMREWIWQKGLTQQNKDYKKINEFLQQFSKMQLARCNFYCGEYPRALMYFEDYITEHPDQISCCLSFLAELFARLDEPDGVAGVMAIQQIEPSIEQRILSLEVSGKLADAAACYERTDQPMKLEHLKGLTRCYLDLDNVNTALNFVQGVLRSQPECEDALWELQAEPLWRLGRYDDLEKLLEHPALNQNDSWGVQIGKALLSFRNGQRDEFQLVVQQLQNQQVEALGAATLEEGAYQHGYGYISRLHTLNEMQRIEKATNQLLKRDCNSTEGIVNQLVSEWELRLKVVQESVKITEPILCLRRVMLNEAKGLIKEQLPLIVPLIDSLLGECWLTSAKTARSAALHQQAYTYTLKAEEYAPPKLFLEKAELHWLREEHEQALIVLKRGLEKIIPESLSGSSSSNSATDHINQLTLEQRKICAEAKLLIASYNDAISNVDTNTNIQHYKSAVETYKEWEKSLVHLAQYYDRVFNSLSEEDRDAKGSDMQIHMINCFGKSLQYGSSYVYQSMPRMLSIWFDYGTRLLDVTNSSIREERKTNLLKMTRLVDSFLERLPAFIFLTAFSQIVSRICHPQKEVYVELKAIIIKLLLQYPQQTLWMIISVVKSSYDMRAKRCSEIFSDSRLKTPEMSRLIRDFTALAEKLMELCNKQIPEHVNSTTVSALLRTLPRMLAKSDFSEIMIPIYKFRKLILPNPDFKSSQHNPFPNHFVHIVGIEDEITVLSSLQRPRKITLKGSDGKKYIQMLKPKDDLRKDFRLMEFNDVVNQLLSQEAEARQRRLNIRLYSVAPLNEECGLIEWVPDLIGLRPVLVTIYKQKGIHIKGRELKELCCNLRDPLLKKREIFLKKLLPRHPPVLGEWFRRTFADAQTWLTARTAYTRTTAVMSMVGYILGLGDRHGENISLDSTCGDVVHVDFNCLFNKGETFEWPERVPFRLTHNMVAAMGPLGVEGVFRRSCAVTLRVLRNNTNTLMSIVAPFVYDPLVSWPRNVPASSNAQNAERTNEQAVEHVKNIELRLQGVMKVRNRSFSIPLSVDGQTNNLIKEATSVDNLCQMYMGWGPYL